MGIRLLCLLLLILPAQTAGAAPTSPRAAAVGARVGVTVAARGPLILLPLTAGELREARQIGSRLLVRFQRRSLVLVRGDREPAQIRQLAARGCVMAPDGFPVALTLPLLRTLDRLSRYATPGKPLALLSLYRPLSPTRPREPHGNGQAIDIWAYGGYTIHSRNPSPCVEGVLRVIKALGPGAYRLGVPKPPGSDPRALLPPPPRPRSWPFFPAPEPVVIDLLGLKFVAPRRENGQLTRNRRGQIRPLVSRWENERYAPPADIGSPRVKRALAEAARRGVVIHSLFPDALDHLHLDVKPRP